MSWKKISLDKNASVKKKKMKFFIDSNLGIGTKEFLTSLGWNCIFADDIGLSGKSDETIYQYAKTHNRSLLTHDTDFNNHRKFPFQENMTIIILPGADGNEKLLIQAIHLLLNHIAPFKTIFYESKIEISNDYEIKITGRNKGKISTIKYKLKKGVLYEWIN